MLTNRASGLYRVHVLCQAVVVALYFGLLLLGFKLVRGWSTVDASDYLVYLVVIVASLLVEAMLRSERLRWLLELAPRHIARNSLSQTVAIGFGLSFFLVGMKDLGISRIYFGLLLVGAYPVLYYCNRYLPRPVLRFLLWRFGRDPVKVLVVDDDGSTLKDFRRRINAGQYPGSRLVGYLSREIPNNPSEALSVGWLGTLEDLEKVASEFGISQVVVPSVDFSREFGRRMMDFCEAKGLRIVLVNDVPKRLGRSLTMTSVGGLEILSPRTEPLEDPLNRMVKRSADIGISAVVLSFVLPLMITFAWIAHRWQSPGPLFYKQERSGRGGQRFKIYKFRSLHVDHGEDSKQVTTNDSRVFPLGALMRKLSIDELPQFWNVLQGQMSLVGPRPHLPEHDAEFAQQTANYAVRHFVKPGITGLAQVKGYRGETRTRNDVRHRVRWDVVYLERWTPWLDTWILWRTAWQCLVPCKKAY
ncbi:MAG: exopolysaccharide biosynthesis polyprenyl glycosylphosphotransferase [Verrucomicrobiota bacterium]